MEDLGFLEKLRDEAIQGGDSQTATLITNTIFSTSVNWNESEEKLQLKVLKIYGKIKKNGSISVTQTQDLTPLLNKKTELIDHIINTALFQIKGIFFDLSLKIYKSSEEAYSSIYKRVFASMYVILICLLNDKDLNETFIGSLILKGTVSPSDSIDETARKYTRGILVNLSDALHAEFEQYTSLAATDELKPFEDEELSDNDIVANFSAITKQFGQDFFRAISQAGVNNIALRTKAHSQLVENIGRYFNGLNEHAQSIIKNRMGEKYAILGNEDFVLQVCLIINASMLESLLKLSKVRAIVEG